MIGDNKLFNNSKADYIKAGYVTKRGFYKDLEKSPFIARLSSIAEPFRFPSEAQLRMFLRQIDEANLRATKLVNKISHSYYKDDMARIKVAISSLATGSMVKYYNDKAIEWAQSKGCYNMYLFNTSRATDIVILIDGRPHIQGILDIDNKDKNKAQA